MKNKFIMAIVILWIFTLIGCGNSNVKLNNKSDTKIVNENGIISLKMHNIKGELKEIKDKNDISKVITLINGLNILKNDIGLKDGVGYGTEITYSDGKKETFEFSGDFMGHNNKHYEIDKNIDDELKNIFDKN